MSIDPMMQARDYAEKAFASECQVDGWEDPQPLPNALPPVAPFCYELLPESLRFWVSDIAERMQCPPDFPAASLVVALSSLIGARAVVQPKSRDDWAVVPNLWGLVVGRPGVMKSPAIAQVTGQLSRLEMAAKEEWEPVYDEWKLTCRVQELAMKAREKRAGKVADTDPSEARRLLADDEMPDMPQRRRYMVNDTTVEKLGEVLEHHPNGLLVYRDEIHGLLRDMDKSGQEGARAFYLQGFDGNQSYTVDRIIRGTHFIPRVCLALLGGIQPGKVQQYVRDAVNGGSGDDGLLQRFGVAVWPDISKEFKNVDRWPDTAAKGKVWDVFQRLSDLPAEEDGEPQVWKFSPEAQGLFSEWYTAIKTEIRGDHLHPALVSHLSKYDKLIPALALVFAMTDRPEDQGVIHAQETLMALAWGDYLRSHAERLYSAATNPETSGAEALLKKLKKGLVTLQDGAFTPRSVAVKGWAGLASVGDVRKAAELLADYGWLVAEDAKSGPRGGRPSTRYHVHPRIAEGSR